MHAIGRRLSHAPVPPSVCVPLTSSGSCPTRQGVCPATVPPGSALTPREGLAGLTESEGLKSRGSHLNCKSAGHRGRSWEEREQPRAEVQQEVFLDLPGSVVCNFVWTLGSIGGNTCSLVYYPRAKPKFPTVSILEELGENTCL